MDARKLITRPAVQKKRRGALAAPAVARARSVGRDCPVAAARRRPPSTRSSLFFFLLLVAFGCRHVDGALGNRRQLQVGLFLFFKGLFEERRGVVLAEQVRPRAERAIA